MPVEADFRGLDVLSAIDYLKALQSVIPSCSREKRTNILNQRRNMPPIVLAHQIASLFPAMQNLEKEVNYLVTQKRIVELPLQHGDVAYIRTEDWNAPSGLSLDLTDDEIRVYSQAGYIMRRNNRLVYSAPNIGAYFSALKAARSWVMAILKRNICLMKDVRQRYENWKDGGIFIWESLMHDLVGSSRVEILTLTVGPALRLTKRGREER